MATVVESKIELLEKLLREADAAMYSALCESNGISDNEWDIDRKRWKAIPQWPMASFWRAIKKLEKVQSKTSQYFSPAESERREKWAAACYTASAIMKEFNSQREEDGARRAESSLHRNIADAVYGVLRASEADVNDGIGKRTMNGILKSLVEKGELVEVTGDTPATPS